MTTAQIIEAIKATARQDMFRAFERPEEKAREMVYGVLRRTNPCACCDGSGQDLSKPFDPLHIVTNPPTCDCCAGRGFAIDGNDDQAVWDWVYSR